jgi:TPR repeat protein
MNPALGPKESVKTTHPTVESFLLVGQRLVCLLKWCVIALVLASGIVLAAVHILGRTTKSPPTQILLAQLYTDDIWWHPTDKAFAKSLLRKAMATGEVKAQYRLARDYENEKNYAEAFSLHQDLALKGFMDSQRQLGWLYTDGRGVSQNMDVGIRWLKSAAAQGDARAQLSLGALYLGDVPNSPKDLAQAVHWLQSSAYLGNARARDTLARLYATGTGVPEDLDLAMQWAKSSYKPATKTIQLIETIRAEKGLLPHGNI